MAGRRALLLLVLAGVLIVTEVLALEAVERPGPLIAWMALVALAALCMAPVAGLGRGRAGAMLDDEGAREHRRTGLATGFWVAVTAALATMVVALFHPLSGPVVARIVVTAGLSAALISFAVQERRAAA
jgi:hypothetical protein